jgi:hypothetical protein
MVSVLDKNKIPLMPCSEKRARKLLESGRAKPYWMKGIFCIIMQDYTKRFKQEIVVAIDPGSKMCGLTVKSNSNTILNIQYGAKTKIKNKVELRKNARKSKRQRNCPYRKCRFNRKFKNKIPPSTKTRWIQHLNFIKFCNKMYPVTHIAFEDVKAVTKKKAKKWNKMFSPLEIGKNWAYNEIGKNFILKLYNGFETYAIRKNLNLKKNKDKLKIHFNTHAVDSWSMANDFIGGHTEPDNKYLVSIEPLNFYRRQLHSFCPAKNNIRRNYGGTRSLGLKRGTLVKHPKYKHCLVGGTSNNRISLHNLKTNKRLTQDAKLEDLVILTNLQWNISTHGDYNFTK